MSCTASNIRLEKSNMIQGSNNHIMQNNSDVVNGVNGINNGIVFIINQPTPLSIAEQDLLKLFDFLDVRRRHQLMKTALLLESEQITQRYHQLNNGEESLING
jgi:hypothetical protein